MTLYQFVDNEKKYFKVYEVTYPSSNGTSIPFRRKKFMDILFSKYKHCLA